MADLYHLQDHPAALARPAVAHAIITGMTGIALARGFYRDHVAPVLAQHAPGLTYSAALIGPGSEVLGYDDIVSRDHLLGPALHGLPL